jgi:hypothetical protein
MAASLRDKISNLSSMAAAQEHSSSLPKHRWMPYCLATGAFQSLRKAVSESIILKRKMGNQLAAYLPHFQRDG